MNILPHKEIIWNAALQPIFIADKLKISSDTGSKYFSFYVLDTHFSINIRYVQL